MSAQLAGVDPTVWEHRRVLLTGHTGFKGAWLGLWLTAMKAQVTGFALSPPSPSLFDYTGLARDLRSVFGNIENMDEVDAVVQSADPEIVIHLAAQSLVRRSLIEPAKTFCTNVLGTVNILDALRAARSLKVILVVTSDKVYANDESGRQFKEEDRLGGYDPYAASKAAVEIVSASYAASYFAPKGVRLATARGGNVIGGGDFSADRIIPDVWRAFSKGEVVRIRNPASIRPWQHVLDCLAGYLIYSQAMWRNAKLPTSLNFGPRGDDQSMTVANLVQEMLREMHTDQSWAADVTSQPREAVHLTLDSSQARELLGWQERLPSMKAIKATASWYRAFSRGEDMREHSLQDIKEYSQ